MIADKHLTKDQFNQLLTKLGYLSLERANNEVVLDSAFELLEVKE